MKQNHLALIPLLLIVWSAAYAADQVSMTYEPQSNDNAPTLLPGACAITVAKVVDIRNNKESIGVEYRPVLSGDPVPWVNAALSNLNKYGFDVRNGGNPAGSAININVGLIRSYVWHGPMRINSMVAMNAEIALPSGEKLIRNYRASGSKTNMWGATSEFMTALNYAINNVMDKLAADLRNMCTGQTALKS